MIYVNTATGATLEVPKGMTVSGGNWKPVKKGTRGGDKEANKDPEKDAGQDPDQEDEEE